MPHSSRILTIVARSADARLVTAKIRKPIYGDVIYTEAILRLYSTLNDN